METVTERINLIFQEMQDEKRAKTQADFGRLLGVTRSAVNQWLSGATKITAENVFLIEDKTGYCARWIATGDGPKRTHEAAPTHPTVYRRKIQEPPLVDEPIHKKRKSA